MANEEHRSLEDCLRRASLETSLHDFGPSDFREPLEKFLEFLDKSKITSAGRAAYLDTVQRWLINRLRFAQDLMRHPEIESEDVSNPIIILGFPRSGTTVLQRMISADPAMQSLQTWRVLNPAPFPNERGKPVERIAVAKNLENNLRDNNPEFFSAHPTFAEDAEEDSFLHNLTARHVGHWFQLPGWEYLTYLRGLARLPTYEYAGSLLRYLQWQDGGARGRRWVMKSPLHLGCLEDLLRVHPQASFVYPKRDFSTVLASFCHLIETHLSAMFAEIDLLEIGSIALDFWRTEMERFENSRRQLGSHLKLLEFSYRDLLSDPILKIRSIYENAGVKLDKSGEQAMRTWLENNPAGKHGKHNYALERYGLSPKKIAESFGSSS